MGRFFVLPDGRQPDEELVLIDEIFHLEDQLAAQPAGGTS